MTDPAGGSRSGPDRPLAGWRVLVTRPADRAAGLLGLLEAAGATAEVVPLISIEPPADPAALDRAAGQVRAGSFGWIGLTSVNAVTALAAALARTGGTVPTATRIAVVGAGTAAAARAAGLRVDLVPDRGGSAAELAASWPAEPGVAVLLPRSDRAAPTLPQALRDKGFAVTEVVAYRTVERPVPSGTVQALRAGHLQAVLLASPSAAQTLAVSWPDAGPTDRALPVVGAIGEPTRAAAEAAGVPVTFTAVAPTDRDLVAGLCAAARGPAP